MGYRYMYSITLEVVGALQFYLPARSVDDALHGPHTRASFLDLEQHQLTKLGLNLVDLRLQTLSCNWILD